MNQALLVSFDKTQTDHVNKIKEGMSIDQSLETFTLRDVDTKKRYKNEKNFAHKLANCMKDSNRIFLIASDNLAKAVDENSFPDDSYMANEDAKSFFNDFLNYEKTLSASKSKLVVIKLFDGTAAPVKLENFECVDKIFANKEIDSLSKESLDIVLSKCRFKNHDFPSKKEKDGCIVC